MLDQVQRKCLQFYTVTMIHLTVTIIHYNIYVNSNTLMEAMVVTVRMGAKTLIDFLIY